MKPFATFALAGAMLLSSSLVHGQSAVQWGCDAPAHRTCYFSIQFASGGVRSFAMPAGRKMMIAGVSPGRDRYQVSFDAPSLGDVNRCRQLNVMGRSCQSKVVDPAYND